MTATQVNQLAQRPAILEAETICPICFTSYNLHDEPEEWLRVVNALCNPDGVNPRASLLQAAHWLRAGAPGRALATIEAALSHQK